MGLACWIMVPIAPSATTTRVRIASSRAAARSGMGGAGEMEGEVTLRSVARAAPRGAGSLAVWDRSVRPGPDVRPS
ncbi:hypothetical protein GCM10028784_25630 [Myceligenerans cantabricum]